MSTNKAPQKPAGRPRGRRKLADNLTQEEREIATRADIIAAAFAEFVAKGYGGASISAITKNTKTSQRMLYYHFKNKEGLYQAVLESGYENMFRNHVEIDVNIDDPIAALRRFAELTFEKHVENEDFVRLIMVENIGEAKILKKSSKAKERGRLNLELLLNIVKSGQQKGVFREDVNPETIYAVIGGLSFNTISNRHSIKALFGTDILGTPGRAERRELIVDAAIRYALEIPVKADLD